MKSLRILALLALALSVAPVLTAADFGIRAGRLNDADEEFVGAEVLIDLGAFNLNPNIEYWLVDDITAGTANLDVTVDIFKTSALTPYAGVGLGVLYVDDDLGDNRTDIVGNLIGGVAFDLAFLEPYGQVKYTRRLEDNNGGDNDEIALTIGLRF